MKQLLKILISASKYLKTTAIVLGLSLSISNGAMSEVVGVMSRSALLNQLQTSLGIQLSAYKIPNYLLMKLPNSTGVHYISPSFVSAWSQLTASICFQMASKNQVGIDVSNKSKVQEWLMNKSKLLWPNAASDEEIQRAVDMGYNTSTSTEPKERKFALSCGYILANPQVYALQK